MVPKLVVSVDPVQLENYILRFLEQTQIAPTSVYRLFPEGGKTISIEQIRQLKKELIVSTTKRVIILYDFQTAKTEAQNALLKTLEDQTEHNQFIVCTTHIGTILPTIISRCQLENLSSNAVAAYDSALSSAIDSLLQDNSMAFLNTDVLQAATIEDAKKLFSNILSILHSRILTGDIRASRIASHALELSALLQTNNLNPQLAIDSWCLFVRKQRT